MPALRNAGLPHVTAVYICRLFQIMAAFFLRLVYVTVMVLVIVCTANGLPLTCNSVYDLSH